MVRTQDTGTTGQRDQKQLCILSMGIKLAVASRVDSTQLQMSNRSPKRVRAGKRQDILLLPVAGLRWVGAGAWPGGGEGSQV